MSAAYPIASGDPGRHAEAHRHRPPASHGAPSAACRLAVAAAALVVLHACATARPPRPPAVGARAIPAGPIEIRVRIDERGTGPRTRTMALEEYVAGCVDAEIGRLDVDAASAVRMRRVQALLCRTFAMANLGRHESEGFDLCSTTHCQLYRHLPPESLTARLAQQAASETSGRIIAFDGRPIQALYHSQCGGRTSAAAAVWGGRAEPYLTSVADPGCELAAKWRSAIERTRLRQALHTDPRTDPGSRLDGVTVSARDQVGRATAVTITGAQSRIARGEAFRTVVTQALGASLLRSTWFVVRREADEFVFEGRGSGHGAGLCQAGALRQAKAGRSDEEILLFYYPGTRLTSLKELR